MVHATPLTQALDALRYGCWLAMLLDVLQRCRTEAQRQGLQPRIERAVVRFRDVDGAPRTLECAGLLARCVQHEHDHCQGVLFIDRMTRAHQLLTATKVKKLQRETKAELKAARKQA